MPVPDPRIVVLFLGLINLWTAFSFWHDKAAAMAGRRRRPEAGLLWLAALGGTPAAYVARHVLRHKTRKQPFSMCLHFIAVLQAGLLIGLFRPPLT